MRVGVVQMSSRTADKRANLEKAARLIGDAKVDLAVLPELFATEFFAAEKDPRFFEYAEPADGEIVSTMAAVAKETGTMIVVPFFEYHQSGIFYNSAALVDADGSIIGIYRKTHIPFTKSFEKFYFAGGGDLPVFDTPFGRIGILICYDRWYTGAWRELCRRGAEIVCVPIASWRVEGASELPFWDALHRIRAREHIVFLAAANRSGVEGTFEYLGRSMIVGPSGEILGQAGEDLEGAVIFDCDLDQVRRERSKWPLLRDTRHDLYR
jgi:predicted amidohydrolase